MLHGAGYAAVVRSAKSTYLLPHKCYCGERLHVLDSRLGTRGALLQHCGRLRRGCRPFLCWMGGPSDWLPTPQELEYAISDWEVTNQGVKKAKAEVQDETATIKAKVEDDVNDPNPHLTGGGLGKEDPSQGAYFIRTPFLLWC